MIAGVGELGPQQLKKEAPVLPTEALERVEDAELLSGGLRWVDRPLARRAVPR